MTGDDEEPGPLTLEEAKEWLLKVEDDATIARDKAYALEFVLGNLLTRMTEANMIDGRGFIAELLHTAQSIPERHIALATTSFLKDLLQTVGEHDWPSKH